MYRTGSLEKVHSYVSKVFTWLHLFQNYPREYQHRKLLFYVIALEFGINKIMQTTIFFLQKQLTGRILGLSLQNHNMSRVVRKPDFAYAKIKVQISFTATAKLIYAFVFTSWIVQFLFFLFSKGRLCRAWSEPPRRVFSHQRSYFLCPWKADRRH